MVTEECGIFLPRHFFPASSAKRIKVLVVETLFGTRSWEAVQQLTIEQLELGLKALQELEGVQRTAQFSEEAAILDLVRDSIAKVAQ
jgi:hypothetical protein